MIADAVIDPMWTTIIQGGAFALLTYVVAYLAPKALREAREEREARDQRFTLVVQVLQQQFDTRSDKVVAAIAAQTTTLGGNFDRALKRVEVAMQAACRVHHEDCAHYESRNKAPRPEGETRIKE